MARLSGLASEHHPVGPGDAPRRKKGRKSNSSVDLAQGSKRAASPSLEPSQSKRKRVQIDEHEQITRELEDSVERSQSQATDTIVVQTATTTTRRTRRASEPLVIAQDDEDDSQITPPPSTQPAPGLTPHLNRIGAGRGRPTKAARRARMSMPPQLDVEAGEVDAHNGIQFAPLTAVIGERRRRSLRRSHLSEEINEIEQKGKDEKKKTREQTQELLALRRQLREKDQAIKDLEFQLEARRMGNIEMSEDHAEELQEQLAQAKMEIAELRASSEYEGESREPSAFDGNYDGMDDDDDGLLLIDPTDLDGPQEMMVDDEPLPNGEFAARALALSSQVTVETLATMSQTTHDVLAEASQDNPSSVPDQMSQRSNKRWQLEYEHAVHDLAEAQGALRIVAIALQNFHFAPVGASTDVILEALQHGFETAREMMENLLPGQITHLTNSEFIRKIPQIVEGLLTELAEKTRTAESYHQRSRKLQHQFETVLDLLAHSEMQNKDLVEQINSLENDNAEKQQSIVVLEERVATLITVTDTQDSEIKQKDAEINGLRDELGDKETNLARLQASIKDYCKELDKVTVTTIKLEEEHRATIENMERAHAEAVRDLEAQLDVETEARAVAEGEAAQKSEFIEELEANLARLEDEFGTVTDQANAVTQLLAEQTELRHSVEAQRDEQANLAYDQANTIENQSEEIQDLKTQVAEFRSNLETERSQRAETEAALDEANQRIADLEDDLHNAGLQANELRSKLFQIQQEKAQAIAHLQELAEEREAEQQNLLDAEIQHRRAAEQDVADADAHITDLEAKIATLEDNIARMKHARSELEMDRDDRVATLNAQFADLKQKYTALESSSSSTITTLQANITDLTNQVNAQQAEIERITDDAAEMERTLREDLGGKVEQIAGLENELGLSKADNENLIKENNSLARRVEEEANELLNMDEASARERAALNQVIDTQAATIQNLQNTVAQRATDYEVAIAEKNQEIEEMRMMGDARAETIAAYEVQLDELKEAFRVAEEDNRRTLDALTESQRKLQEQNEELAAALKQRNANALKAVQEMKVKGVEVRTRGADLHKVSNGKITKVSERVKVGKKGGKKRAKRQWDSGFGVDENIENEGDELAPEDSILG
ncbi:hypothetical protein K458DRAFT_309808 [Lentithecium fluviatile CBS 122367]|uniref:Uncharacterized protein n=1 Tax=Lentithecium fluviatile CBS 122367 TaxID=1168545 RepID=A0A6G1ITA2_9PLEO|nr:hypothetical protein K458DRAFT_309808 [Lentithecium fluviatile CBS 122367]